MAIKTTAKTDGLSWADVPGAGSLRSLTIAVTALWSSFPSGVNNYVFGRTAYLATGVYGIFLNSDGAVTFFVYNSGSTQIGPVTPAAFAVIGLNRLICRWWQDASNSHFEVWNNGALYESVAATNQTLLTRSTVAITLGPRPSGNIAAPGVFSEAAIWSGAVPAGFCQEYCRGISPAASPNNLIFHAPLIYTPHDVVRGLRGTLVGVPSWATLPGSSLLGVAVPREQVEIPARVPYLQALAVGGGPPAAPTFPALTLAP